MKLATGCLLKAMTARWGTRPMTRIVQENLKKPLANELLFGSLVDGGSVSVALDKSADKLTYHFMSAQKIKEEGAVH
ncbi:hypothetical protein O1V64_21665 [Rouxiella badensis]|nr:hypothetical protein O1V64_21665 [Rouxiella badensis]